MEIHLNNLIHTYKNEQICLFTGAGVSFTSKKKFRTPGWWGLLNEVYKVGQNQYSYEREWISFTDLKEKSIDAWTFVDRLIEMLGSEAIFQDLLIKSLIKETGTDKKYKRLPVAFLNSAETLNAVIAFCSMIKNFNKYQCFKTNKKIRAVLTLNYDWYLEGGATQKYNANPFKPMVNWYSKELKNKLQIYHLHGYIPHDKSLKLRSPLIMSSKSYEEIYLKNKSWTKEILKCFLSRFITIFIGISFDDSLLVEYMIRLAKSSENWPNHYFIAKKGSFNNDKLKKLELANIHPIWINQYNEISKILKLVYLSGLKEEDFIIKYRIDNSLRKIDGEYYWNLLLGNKI